MLQSPTKGASAGLLRLPTPIVSATVTAPTTTPKSARISQVERLRLELGPDLQTFLELFQPAAGLFKPKGKGWFTPRRRDPRSGVVEPVTLTHWAIEKAYATGYGRSPQVIGLRFTNTTRHGLIDLDGGSPYRTLEHLQAFIQAAADLGLVITPCQSSESEGWHLYLTTLEPIPSKAMSAILKAIATAAGVDAIKDGRCEVYPNTADPDQGVRLPGQAGFGFLKPYNGQVATLFDAATPAENIRRVLWMFSEQANSPVAINEALKRIAAEPAAECRAVATEPHTTAELGKTQLVGESPTVGKLPTTNKGGRPASKAKKAAKGTSWDAPVFPLVKAHDRNATKAGTPLFHDPENARGIAWFYEGRQLYRKGLQAPNSRHEATQAVGFYLLFAGFTTPASRADLLKKWIRKKHNGQSEAVNAERWAEIDDEIDRLTASKAADETKAPDARVVDFYQAANRRKKNQARTKLEQAIADLEAAGKPATYRAIRELTKLSHRTIAKHLAELKAEATNQVDVIEPKPQLSTCKAEQAIEVATETTDTLKASKPLVIVAPEYLATALGLVDRVTATQPIYKAYHGEVVMALLADGHTEALKVAALAFPRVYAAFKLGATPSHVAAEITDAPEAVHQPRNAELLQAVG